MVLDFDFKKIGLKKNKFVLAGGVLAVLVLVLVVVFVLKPFGAINNGALGGGGLENQVAQRINAGASVNSKAQATGSLVSLSKELESVSGSISEINENLEKQAVSKENPFGPSGLLVFGEAFLTSLLLFAFVVAVFVASKRLGSKQN